MLNDFTYMPKEAPAKWAIWSKILNFISKHVKSTAIIALRP